MSKETLVPLQTVVPILFSVYLLIHGVLSLFKPIQWTRSRWSLYPPQFLYLLDYPLGRLQVRVLGFIFSVVACRFLMLFVYAMAGVKHTDPFTAFTLPMPVWGVGVIIVGSLSIIAPRWMFDPKSDNSRNRPLYKMLLRLFGVVLVVQGLILITSGEEQRSHPTLERFFTPALLTAILAILGYFALNGIMYCVRPKEWAGSRFSLAVPSIPEHLDSGKTPRSVRIQGLVHAIVAVMIGIILILVYT